MINDHQHPSGIRRDCVNDRDASFLTEGRPVALPYQPSLLILASGRLARLNPARARHWQAATDAFNGQDLRDRAFAWTSAIRLAISGWLIQTGQGQNS